jgi:zinc/manganese transport system ATP-binding protein
MNGRRDAVVELDGAVFAYRGGPVVLRADVRFERGCLTGIVGPSGAGKTTLLRAVIGEVRPVRGTVRVGGDPVRRRPRITVGYVPQVGATDWHFPITVAQVVLLGLTAESGPWPWATRAERRRVDEVLGSLGIEDLADRPARELSGGQQQRVLLARALIRRPQLLLLDEPTSGVDVLTRSAILDELIRFHRAGLSIILTTHDLNAVANRLPDLVCINRTVVARGTPEAVLNPSDLAATFGSEMVVLRHDGLLLATDIPSHEHHDLPLPAHRHHVHVDHDHPLPGDGTTATRAP